MGSGRFIARPAQLDSVKRTRALYPRALETSARVRFDSGLVCLAGCTCLRSNHESVAPRSLPRPPCGCSFARRIRAPGFHVLDECPQFGQDLRSRWVVQEDPWRGDGEAREECLQSAFGDRRSGQRSGDLRKPHTLDRRSQECGVVVRDQRPRDDRLHLPVAVYELPGGNRAV